MSVEFAFTSWQRIWLLDEERKEIESNLPLSHDQPAVPRADAPAVLDKGLSDRRFKNADLVQRMFTTPSYDFQWFCFMFVRTAKIWEGKDSGKMTTATRTDK